MSNVEDILRDEFRRLAGQPQPSLDKMLGRARRARRRTAIATAALATAVAITLTSIVLTRASTPPIPPAGVLPKGMTIHTSYMSFPEPQHGMLLAYPCVPASCTPWLVSTSDGGASWTGWPLPADAPQHGELRIFDRNRAAYLEPNWPSLRMWHTADAGRNWTARSTTPTRTITEIPPLAQAELEEVGRQLTVFLPDGTVATLAGELPLPTQSEGSLSLDTASDGSGWLQRSVSDQTHVLRTRDRGATWAAVPPPPGFGESGRIVTGNGRDLYALGPFAKDYPIWYSADDGASWQRIATPFPPVSSYDEIVFMTPPTGELVLAKEFEGIWFKLRPGASAFGPGASGRAKALLGSRYFTGAGDPYDGLRPPIYHSLDGLHWTEINLG